MAARKRRRDTQAVDSENGFVEKLQWHEQPTFSGTPQRNHQSSQKASALKPQSRGE
jgi:hypothetical protein